MRPMSPAGLVLGFRLFRACSNVAFLKLKTKAKNRSECEIGRFTPSDWSKTQNEAHESGWARVGFQVLFT